jgi:hypothetical protein
MQTESSRIKPLLKGMTGANKILDGIVAYAPNRQN